MYKTLVHQADFLKLGFVNSQACKGYFCNQSGTFVNEPW